MARRDACSAAAGWPSCTPRSPTTCSSSVADNYQRRARRDERRAFEFVSEGLTFAVQAVPVRADDGTIESAARRRPRHHRAHPRRAADRAPRAPAERRRRARSLRAGEPRPQRADDRGGDDGDAPRSASTWAACSSSTRPAAALGRRRHRRPRRLDRRAGDAAQPERERGRRHTLRTGEPTIVEDMATETRFKPVADPARARRRQQPQRPDRAATTSPSASSTSHAREPRVFSEDEVAFLDRGRDADHRRRRARPRRAGDAPRRAARPAHRPAEPHARARPARPCAGPPAARAHRRGGVRARPRPLQD